MVTNPVPQRMPPDQKWQYFELWETINKLIRVLPNYFNSDIVIKGVDVTDLYSVGALFSTAIESNLVDGLNRTRNLWDADNKYLSLAFKRQSQTFPDVLLVDSLENKIIFGIELKAWYALSKEGEPSFRFKIDPDACDKPDLLVVFPWLLSDVTAGKPVLLSPFVELAKYAAQMRNYNWQRYRTDKGEDPTIKRPNEQYRHPYPKAKQKSSDSSVNDQGNNFGRIARPGQGGLLDNYLAEILNIYYLGIKLKHWSKIFKSIADGSSDEQINTALDRVLGKVQQELSAERSGDIQQNLFHDEQNEH
jgi:hypothetical protein